MTHPLVRRVFSPTAATRLLALWQQRSGLLAAYARVPQTVCHLDAFSRNLFGGVSDDGHAGTIAIDWALLGHGALGEELGALVINSAGFGDVDLDTLGAFDQTVFQSYLDGLHDVGWQGAWQTVRLGYSTSVALRWGLETTVQWLRLALDETTHGWAEQVIGRPIADALEQCGALVPHILAVADEAQQLVDAGW